MTRDDLGAVLGDPTAVVVLSQVDYRSGALLDLAAVTAQVHDAGAVVVWDLCHPPAWYRSPWTPQLPTSPSAARTST
ncbi:MAG: hypothetical protein WKF83_00810 [Nocardioidaceae bacterium]